MTRMDIHWRQGQFLRQHHFQAFQAGIGDRLGWERSLACDHPWGVLSVEVDTQALAAKRVAFRNLCAVLPESGTVVDIAGGSLVDALDIGPALERTSQPLIIRLGVPKYDPRRPNATVPGRDAKGELLRYHVVSKPRFDDNLGEESFEVEFRQLHARLFVEGSDAAGMESIPVLQVNPAVEGGGAPTVDGDFVPPCIRISGSHTLVRELRSLVSQIRVTAEEQLRSLARDPAFNPANALFLQTLGRSLSHLSSMELSRGSVSPLDLYRALDTLLWELLAFDPQEARPLIPVFSHERPGPGLLTLFGEVLPRIRPVGPPTNLIKVPFRRDQDVLVADLEEEHFTRPTQYHLMIRSKRDRAAITNVVQDRNGFKIMPFSKRYFGGFGVPAVEDPTPPPQLKPQPDTMYYRLQREAEKQMWEQIRDEKKMSVFCDPKDLSTFDELVLCMIVPE